jgi:iron complex outermembrane recepter protein
MASDHYKIPVQRCPGLSKLSLAVALAVTQTVAAAEDAAPVNAVTVTGQKQVRKLDLNKVELDASSPRSTLTAQAIEQIATPFSDYGTLANLMPSFVSSAPNGQGFDAAKNQSLRGFPDGQFNVTLDGIPFADPDGFAHHSTSVFPASSIDRMVMDRSPGSAIDLGYSTIGGSINIFTSDVSAKAGSRLYGSYGSFATTLIGVRLNTAQPQEDGQTGLMINMQHLQSDGAMTNALGRRDDVLLKSETKIGSAQLTALYSYDRYHFNNPPSVTTDQIAQFGANFGFTDKPGLPTFSGYGATDRTADFGYLRLQLPLGTGWKLSETLYSYSYNNRGLGLKGDASSAAASNIGSGFTVPATDIGGRVSDTKYRVAGNIVQLEYGDGVGTFRGGLWLDRSHQKSYRQALDLTTGAPYNANKNANSSYQFDWKAELETVQPFVEYEWRVNPQWNVKPGLRYQSVKRTFEATVVPTSQPGTNGSIDRKVNSTLPSLSTNYALMPDTNVYAQWSNGALVPNQSFFYTASPAAGNQVKPQTSRALQTGLRHASAGWAGSVDAYLIDFKDYISASTDPGTKITSYLNGGKVRYKGLEFEGNAELGLGFSAVGNASVLSAKFQQAGMTNAAQLAGDDIALVPKYTGLLGLVYQRAQWNGSVLTKFIGLQNQGRNGSSDGPNFQVAAYSYTNVTVGRGLDDLLGMGRSRLSFQINNVEGRHPVTDTAGPSVAGPLNVNVLAGRNYTLSLSVEL